MIKNRFVAFVLFVVLVLVFWNVIDYLVAAFITRSPWQFPTGSDMITPLVVSIVMGCILFLRKPRS